MIAEKLKTGDFVETNPLDRDVRVGVVGQVVEYPNGLWFFDAVVVAVKPENGEFYSVHLSSYSSKDEGRLWRRLAIVEQPQAEEVEA